MNASADNRPLKSRTAWNHLQAIERAEQIVNSWPEWKRDIPVFRGVRGSDVKETEGGPSAENAEKRRAA